MKAVGLAAALVVLLAHAAAHAQTASVELTQSGGVSTEEVAAAGTQLRVFGELPARVRFTVEGAWGARSVDEGDFFGGAYPYHNRVQVIEAYAERTFRPGPALLGIRVGRYRTPFGISAGSEHAYFGFLRAPLIRYDDYYALSNDFLEHGIDVIAGTPHLTLEASAGAPADVGEAHRRRGLDTVVRGQAHRGALIAGVSYIRTRPYQSPLYARGRARFTGADVRWMRGGVQLRGEWISGRPFDRATTFGGYADLIVHRPGMGPMTAVFRAERLVYDAAPPYSFGAHRYTGGARVRVRGNLAVSAALVVHRSDARGLESHTSLDLGVSYAVRRE